MAGVSDFVSAQKANRRNTLLLLALLTALAAAFGYVLGWALEGEATDTVPLVSAAGLVVAGGMTLASVGWSALSLAVGNKIVLAIAQAKPIEKSDAPQLFNVVEEMSIAAGVPMPKIYVMEDEALNAFATGTSTKNSAIAVTRGLLNALNRDELQGVVAHEMSHIANLDTRYMTVVGVTVGLIALVADMCLRALNWGSYRSSSNKKESSGGSGFLVVILDRKSTRLNSSHVSESRMPSSA